MSHDACAQVLLGVKSFGVALVAVCLLYLAGVVGYYLGRRV